MRASIVIVTYGQRALTEQCLRSIEGCLGDRLGVDWELVLIDNDSPDDTAALLRAWSDRAHVTLLGENRNFAGGCNAGAAVARGEVLVFLNNDTEVLPGALQTIVEQALEPGVAVAGCRLLFPDGTLQHAGVAFVRGQAMGGAVMAQHVFHHQDQSLAAGRGIYEMDCVTAACMAVRADVFRAVGGFDQRYRNGLEDVDLCLRIRVAGERIVYRGDATVVHHEGASRGRGEALWASKAKLEMMRHNDALFISTWGAQLDPDDGLAARLWDAALEDRPPRPRERCADVVVAGQPFGIGPAGDESRAWLRMLAHHGRVAAAGDWPVPIVVPRLTGPIVGLLHEARRRLPLPGADWLYVMSGVNDEIDFSDPAVVRVASPRTAMPLERATAWATSPAVAERLMADGLPAERVRVVPPPVLDVALGEGGGGVLAVLPAHDPRLARAVLEALQALGSGVPVRLVPTVFTRGLDRELAAALPGAELLGPCSDEARFAQYAADADIVLAVDPSDRYERRALIAAAAGAAPLTLTPDGPAAAVLGDGAAVALESLAGSLAGHLEAGPVRPADRAALADRVRAECGPEALPRHLAAAPLPAVAA